MTEVHVRTATLEYSEGQLFGLLVPYDVTARVVDVMSDGKLDVYDEGFRSGAFEEQLRGEYKRVIGRVSLWHTHDHQEGAGYLGPARALEEKPEGLAGEFKILTSKRADVADLLGEGHVDLSIEFREKQDTSKVDDAGVRWRTKAHLGGVALDPAGAYPGAEVLSYRSVPELLAEYERQQEREAEGSDAEIEREEAESERRLAEGVAAAALEAAAAKARRQAEIADWLREATAQQVELAGRFR